MSTGQPAQNSVSVKVTKAYGTTRLLLGGEGKAPGSDRTSPWFMVRGTKNIGECVYFIYTQVFLGVGFSKNRNNKQETG